MREKEREKEGGLAYSDSDREDFSRQSSFKSEGAGGGRLGGMGGSTGRIGRTESPAIGGIVNGAGREGGSRGGGGGGVVRPKQSLGQACRILGSMVLGKYLNLLFVFMPLGLMARYMAWGPGPVFFLNFVALIPLASMLGDLTEEVADYMGDTSEEGGREGGREGGGWGWGGPDSDSFVWPTCCVMKLGSRSFF